MTPQAALRWARSSFAVAGLATPLVMARYARLTALNRTSRDRIIAKVPARVASTASALAPAQGDVVVPVYNNFDDTRGLLAALAADTSLTGRIILVHDCSTDARLAPLLADCAARDARVTLLTNEKNSGFVRTCNRGIMASSRDVVILNTDIVLPQGAVARILRRLQSDARIASVTPFSNCAYGVGIPDLLYDNAQPFGASVAELDAAVRGLPAVSEIELPSGIGFCMGMSRSAIAQLGAFDEAFGLGYGEETDFCMRAARAGFKHVLASDCYVGHKGGQSFGNAWQDMARAGTLKVLHRHPVFVSRVARYLKDSETRSLSLAAFVRLAETTSGVPVRIIARPDTASQVEPVITVSRDGATAAAALSWRGQSHPFRFASDALLQDCLSLCGATFA